MHSISPERHAIKLVSEANIPPQIENELIEVTRLITELNASLLESGSNPADLKQRVTQQINNLEGKISHLIDLSGNAYYRLQANPMLQNQIQGQLKSLENRIEHVFSQVGEELLEKAGAVPSDTPLRTTLTAAIQLCYGKFRAINRLFEDVKKTEPYTQMPQSSAVAAPNVAASPASWLRSGQPLLSDSDRQNAFIQQNAAHLQAAAHNYSLFEKHPSLDNVAAIEEFTTYANEMRAYINLAALADLKKRLVEAVGPKLAEKMMEDWSLIGRDVQQNLAILDDRRKDFILLKAKEFGGHELDSALVELKKNLDRGLPLSELEARFPHLAGKSALLALPLGALADKAKIYRNIINHAMINELIRHPAAFAPDPMAEKILSLMGYNPKNYADQEMVDRRMGVLLNIMLGDENVQSAELQEVRRRIHTAANEARLLAAGVAEKDVKRVDQLINTYQQFRKKVHEEAIRRMRDSPELNEIGKQQPQYRLYLERKLAIMIRNFVDDKLEKMFREEGTAHPENLFTDNVQEELIRKVISKIPNATHSYADWNRKYGSYIVAELIQGFESDAALSEGCCYGITSRVADNAKRHPLRDELLSVVIMPRDRVLQAKHVVADLMQLKEGARLVRPGLHDAYEDEVEFKADTAAEFVEEMMELDIDPECNGVVKLMVDFKDPITGRSISGHATMIQIDHPHGAYRIFDPNIGLLRIPKDPNKSDQQMSEECLIAYTEMLELLYPDRGYSFTGIITVPTSAD